MDVISYVPIIVISYYSYVATCCFLLLCGPLILQTCNFFILMTIFFMCDSPTCTRQPENAFLRCKWRSK